MRPYRRGPLLDALPELFSYRDDGCEVSPSCLRCPLPICKYDDPGWLQRQRRERRDEEIMRVFEAERPSVPDLAARFGVSDRTVFRILSRHRRPLHGRSFHAGMRVA